MVGKFVRMVSMASLCCFIVDLFSGCVVVEKVYMQDVEVDGPIHQPPVHITRNVQEHPLSISPRISINRARNFETHVKGHSPVNSRGFYQVDTVRFSDGSISLKERDGVNVYEFRGKNLSWSIPSAAFALDIDYALTNHLALSLGVNYSIIREQGFWGGNAGVGLFGEGQDLAFRLDGGIHWQTVSYDASTVVVSNTTSIFGTSPSYVTFFHDREKETHINVHLAFTLNTTVKNWFVNPFVQLAISEQTLVDFEPSHLDGGVYGVLVPFIQYSVDDARTDQSTTFFIGSSGVYFDLNASNRVLVGVRFIEEIEAGMLPYTFVIPFLQFDWRL